MLSQLTFKILWKEYFMYTFYYPILGNIQLIPESISSQTKYTKIYVFRKKEHTS